jgi:hypothetical protein
MALVEAQVERLEAFWDDMTLYWHRAVRAVTCLCTCVSQ